jgi:PAS domain S-box-containing protein
MSTSRPDRARSATTWIASRDQLATALLEAADGITIQDHHGAVVFANWAAARAMGLASPDELIRLSADELLDRYELLDTWGERFPMHDLPGRRAMRGEQSPEALIRFRERGGDGVVDRWALVRATPVTDDDGAVQFVISSFQDVSAQKRIETSLRLLADAGSVLGRAGDYLETLQELARLLVPVVADWCVVDVLDPASNLRRAAVAHSDPEMLRLAEDAQRRYPPDMEQEGGVGEVLRSGTPRLYPIVSEAQLAEGAVDDEHLALLRLLDLRSVAILPIQARGSVLGALTLIRGHMAVPFSESELPFLEELARRAGAAVDSARLLHESHDALRMRDEFLAMASHDMRTPLAAIIGYLQLAERWAAEIRDPDGGKLHAYLTSAERMSQKLAALVGELMDISLLSSGQPLPLEEDPVDLVALARGVVDGYRRLSPIHRFRVVASARVTARGDRARLERVLDNLVSNAVKYSPDGGPIVVEVSGTNAEGLVEVRDKGLGIPAQELPRLFERFHRGSNVLRVRGTGLGLAGSLEVVRQLGGNITVESTEGAGSSFAVHVPLFEPVTQTATRKQATGRKAAPAKRKRVEPTPVDAPEDPDPSLALGDATAIP